MQLVIATRNSHKLQEIRDVLDLDTGHVKSSLDFPEIPEVVEDQDTLEGNAVKKAATIAAATGCWALADDSGLEVDALGGAPGVYSARYAGEHCSYDDNNDRLLRELDGITDRRATFRTVLALADPAGRTQALEGTCKGSIATERCGEKGHGYDPIFIPKSCGKTFAEIDSAEKNRISHRGCAMRRAQVQWGMLFARL